MAGVVRVQREPCQGNPTGIVRMDEDEYRANPIWPLLEVESSSSPLPMPALRLERPGPDPEKDEPGPDILTPPSHPDPEVGEPVAPEPEPDHVLIPDPPKPKRSHHKKKKPAEQP